jgi:hypothetical protein
MPYQEHSLWNGKKRRLDGVGKEQKIEQNFAMKRIKIG